MGKSCGATVCTNDVCWGDDVPTPLSAEKVADYLAILAGDFEWYLAGVDGVASFSWSSVQTLFWFCTHKLLRTGPATPMEFGKLM